jgi:hypothetical protein
MVDRAGEQRMNGPPSRLDVQKAYTTLDPSRFSKDRPIPAGARAALLKAVADRVGDNPDAAQFGEQRVGGHRTYAALVPGVDWQDLPVVTGRGEELAFGTYEAGSLTATWADLPEAPPKIDGKMRVSLRYETEGEKEIIRDLFLMVDAHRALGKTPGPDDNGVLPPETLTALAGFTNRLDDTVAELTHQGIAAPIKVYLTKLKGWVQAIEAASANCATAAAEPPATRDAAITAAKAAGKTSIDAATTTAKLGWVDLVDGDSKIQPFFDPTPGATYCQLGLLNASATKHANAPTKHQAELDRALTAMVDPNIIKDLDGAVVDLSHPWDPPGPAAKMAVIEMLEEPGILWQGMADGDWSPGGRVAKMISPNVWHAQEAFSASKQTKVLFAQALLDERKPEVMVRFNTLHELMHAIGPKTVYQAGKEVTLDDPSKFPSVVGGVWGLDEPKADVGALWVAKQLVDKGELSAEELRQYHIEFLLCLLGYAQGDEKDSHTAGGRANLNYLLEKGALSFDEAAGKWNIDHARLDAVIPQLVSTWITLERSGDDTAAKAFFDKYGKTDGPVAQSIAKLQGIPNFDKLNIQFDRSQVGLPDTTSF